MPDSSLHPFFNPRGVAVIGASRDPSKLGYGLARNLVHSGYQGSVHFVNPKGDSLLGLPIYPNISSVPDPVDLAVVLAPPPAVAGILRECGERGIRASIVATGGFRETGPEGAALEMQCLEVARHYGMRLIGPNCIGLNDTHVPLDTTFLQPPGPLPGEVAFISHSGAICAAVIDWLNGQGMGLSTLVSLGNQVDVNETDVLGYLGEDRYTQVITMYMEGVSDGRRFVEQARQVTPHKPVVVLKVGRFEGGRRAAASHTGALAGQESGFNAAFQRAGVIRAGTTEEMFHWARALAWCPLPKGRRVAVLTSAGGPGVTAADAIELNGLELASLSESTRGSLKSLLPAAASVNNPVDMLAGAMPEHYAACLRLLLADPGVDSVIVISPPPPPSTTGAIAKALIPIIQMADKPVIATWMGDRLIQEAVYMCRAAQVVEVRFTEWAASILGVLSQRFESLAHLDQEPLIHTNVDKELVSRMLKDQPSGEFISQEAANCLLEAYGIPTLKMELASTPAQAAALADKAGYPVVLKVASPDIPHKSDVGGVLLNVKNAAEVAQGFETITQKARIARPEANIEGVHVQRMLPPGQEVIVGVVRDAQFGPVVMFGSGGVEVEGLKDVAFALAPVTCNDAERLLESTWAGRKLKGFRSLVPADREAVLGALSRLAQLAADFPQLAEIEINPLRVLPAGQGAFAIDVRARLG